jgi:hypothetical protein
MLLFLSPFSEVKAENVRVFSIDNHVSTRLMFCWEEENRTITRQAKQLEMQGSKETWYLFLSC